jgi:AraC-like DNA-binding protein
MCPSDVGAMTPIGPLRPGVFATGDDPWDHPRNPGSIALLCRFGARAGVEADVLLAGSGVSAHALGNPQLYVDARQEAAVMRNLIDLYDARAALGIDVGRDYHLTAYGYFGYLLINCATMLEVVTVALRFAPLTFAFTTWSARLSESGDYVLTFHADHLPSEIRRFAVERDVAASIQLQRELFPNSQGLPLRSVHFDFPPHSSPTYSNYFQAPVLFDQPTTQLVFEQSYLDMPLPLANPYTKLTLTRHCEGIRDTVLSRTGVVASVRSHLLTEQDLSAGLESTARQLYFTPRTLRRRLRESGTTYREVVDEVRRTLARELMTQTTLTKHEIAERLGYCDLSAFLRALRRWHG